jgi:predicted RNA methylase
MEGTESYRVFLRPGLADSENLKKALEISRQVKEILKDQKVKDAIAEVHKFGASSHKVQKSILDQMVSLGFVSEKKGLFA